MSKKDYQAIARVIYAARIDQSGAPTFALVVKGLADYMAQDSPRFDRARFIEACETGTTRGMKRTA